MLMVAVYDGIMTRLAVYDGVASSYDFLEWYSPSPYTAPFYDFSLLVAYIRGMQQ